jgi:hypothetical protein
VGDFHRTCSELCASEGTCEASLLTNTNVANVIINKEENIVYSTLRIPLLMATALQHIVAQRF